jgi:hypothetical protein
VESLLGRSCRLDCGLDARGRTQALQALFVGRQPLLEPRGKADTVVNALSRRHRAVEGSTVGSDNGVRWRAGAVSEVVELVEAPVGEVERDDGLCLGVRREAVAQRLNRTLDRIERLTRRAAGRGALGAPGHDYGDEEDGSGHADSAQPRQADAGGSMVGWTSARSAPRHRGVARRGGEQSLASRLFPGGSRGERAECPHVLDKVEQFPQFVA